MDQQWCCGDHVCARQQSCPPHPRSYGSHNSSHRPHGRQVSCSIHNLLREYSADSSHRPQSTPSLHVPSCTSKKLRGVSRPKSCCDNVYRNPLTRVDVPFSSVYIIINTHNILYLLVFHTNIFSECFKFGSLGAQNLYQILIGFFQLKFSRG